MSVESGKYFAIPVQPTDPEFEIDISVTEGLSVISGQRTSLSISAEATNEIDAIKNRVQEGISEIKKGGWKSALSFAKKAASDYMTDDKEKTTETVKSEKKDPMDPINAFAFRDIGRVKYELIHLLDDKHKNSNIYQFRSDSAYGVLIPQGNDVLQEISFTYPSHEYAEKHYPDQNVGHSVHNWRREDDELHRMRIHYLSKDKNKAEAAAKSADESKIKEIYFGVDRQSTRAGEETRFSAPDLKLNPKSGELSLNFLYAWFLPRKTQAGRQIQYNWDALRVRVTQGDKLIKRVVCWSNSKEIDYIKSLRTNMELMNGGYIGELEAGKYEFRVAIYNDEVMVYPFEVIKTVSTDNRTAVETYYTLKTPKDDFSQLDYCDESFQLEIKYPLRQLVPSHGSVEKFEFSCKIMRDGKSWPDYDVSDFNASNMQHVVDVRNNLEWMERIDTLQVPFGSQAEYQGREAVPNGVYTLHISIDGEERDQINFEIIDGKLSTQAVVYPTELAMAEFGFPQEHGCHLFPLKK